MSEDRVKELRDIIKKSEEELDKIQKEKDFNKNKSFLGKYYKDFCSYGYNFYKIIGLNESGKKIFFSFYIDDCDNINIRPKLVCETITKDMEISKNEFDENFNKVKKFINELK